MSQRDSSDEYVDFDLPEPEIGLEGDSSDGGFDFREPIPSGSSSGEESGAASDPEVLFLSSESDWSDDRMEPLRKWEGRLSREERRLTWFLTCVMMATLMGLAAAIVGPMYLPIVAVNAFTIILCFSVGAIAGLAMVIPALKRWVG